MIWALSALRMPAELSSSAVHRMITVGVIPRRSYVTVTPYMLASFLSSYKQCINKKRVSSRCFFAQANSNVKSYDRFRTTSLSLYIQAT
jgi:hypothetical protein